MAADNTSMDTENWMPEWLVQARSLLYQDFLFAEIAKKKTWKWTHYLSIFIFISKKVKSFPAKYDIDSYRFLA